ncbi:MAG: HAMP domain-containing protein [Chloroflexi bacterium]|nr:HAMP domain-containing protein [Chloroflexota bacterium]
MFRSVQWRIAVPFILLIVVSMGILGVYLTSFARNSQLDNLRSHLEKEARITAEASLLAFLSQGSDLDALAKKLGEQIDARITIIALDGKVLGDSQEDPSTMENHATRPEVKDALVSGLGKSTRYSTTVEQEMMYVAVPITNQGKILGVARVALPLVAVQHSVNQITLIISLAMVTTTLLAIVAAGLIARATTRPIREITKASRRIASGELGQKIPVRTKDETGQLAQAFNEMSSDLNKLVGDISTERTKLRTVLANMADGVIMADAEGKIVLANQATERLFNIREKDVITKHLIEVLRDHEAHEILKLCLKTTRTQTVQFDSVASKRFLRAIAIPIVEGKLTGALLLFQDLTELRNLQTMRRELVGNISHELRTPIAGIKAMVETLKDGAIDDKQAATDFLSRIDSEVDRLAQMVSELTELSRIETGKAELRMTPVDINVLIEEVATQLSPLAERQQVTLATNLATDLPIIKADNDRIRQTIINLVHNAIKFNHPGGRATVSTKVDRESVTVSVSDTGIGISKEDLPHVFERFYKADKARPKGGSGLGLAIAKHTIQAHGGSIWAQSEEGKGSTFSFSLPLKVTPDASNP